MEKREKPQPTIFQGEHQEPREGKVRKKFGKEREGKRGEMEGEKTRRGKVRTAAGEELKKAQRTSSLRAENTDFLNLSLKFLFDKKINQSIKQKLAPFLFL